METKSEWSQKLDESVREFDALKIDRRQLKAMVKNQNYHFTELQKEIGMLKNRMKNAEKTCDEVPGLIEWTEVTDNYLQNYLPTETYAEIHRAISAALESAPTKMRLDTIEYSHKRMMEALDKIKQVNTMT